MYAKRQSISILLIYSVALTCYILAVITSVDFNYSLVLKSVNCDIPIKTRERVTVYYF